MEPDAVFILRLKHSLPYLRTKISQPDMRRFDFLERDWWRLYMRNVWISQPDMSRRFDFLERDWGDVVHASCLDFSARLVTVFWLFGAPLVDVEWAQKCEE